MGVIVDTAHKVLDLFGAGIHGFTPGNALSGVAPTELHANWTNAVQQELNNAIIPGLDGLSLNPATHTQLNTSILNQIVSTYPRDAAGSYTYTFRSMGASFLSGSGALCMHRKRTEHKNAAASGTNQDLCAINTPSDSQCTATYRVSVVRSDDIADYGNAIIHVSLRNASGTVTIQSTATALSDISLAGLTFTVQAASANVRVRIAIPAMPANKTYNIFVHGELTNVNRT